MKYANSGILPRRIGSDWAPIANVFANTVSLNSRASSESITAIKQRCVVHAEKQIGINYNCKK